MILLSKCLFWSTKKCYFCKLQYLVATQDKSINFLYVNCCSALLPHRTSLSISFMLKSISHKTFTRSIENQFSDRNMSNSRLKHPKSENDKFMPVSEIISFFNWRNLVLLKKKEGSGFHFFTNLRFI